jgi:uncharacterized protein (DUF1501 family)
MHNSLLHTPATRREFLRLGTKGVGLIAFAHYAPAFLAQSALAQAPGPEADRTILVLLQLAGGNDGLNTVIPYASSRYRQLRPTLAVRESDVLRIGDGLGLHPACTALQALLNDGKLAIVQNVGYPNPNRSHFRSTEIWETGSDSDESLSTGWVGRYFDNACAGTPSGGPVGVHLSGEVPQSFGGKEPHNTFGAGGGRARQGDSLRLLENLAKSSEADPLTENGNFLRHTMMDALVTERRVQRVIEAYRPQAQYPGTPLAQSLRSVAALISGGLPTRVYFVSLGGFDTHANQAASHPNLLRTLGDAMTAFQRDLEAHRLDGQVMTMTFSEFGRRAAENESRGTDHGTAAPLFVMGKGVKAGLYGTPPVLDMPANEDPEFSTDFRQVYATVLDGWLGCSHTQILGREFRSLGFL